MVTAVLFQPFAFACGLTDAWISGGVRSTVRLGVMLDDPPRLVPTMVSVCAPSAPRSKPCTVQWPFATVAGTPLTVTVVALPLPPARSTVLLLTKESGCGRVSERTGFGTVTTDTCAEAVLLTAFVATAVIVTGEAMPERSSVACHVPSVPIVAACPLTVTVTGLMSLTVPRTATCVGSETTELSAGEVMAMCGTPVSILTVTLAVLRLPALSTASPVTVCAAVSLCRTTSSGQVRMPLKASLQVKLTVTAELFQPAAFGAGARLPLIAGNVRSTVSAGVMVSGPAALVPTMVSVCGPSAPRLKPCTVQMPLAIVAGVPLTVTLVAVPLPPESVTLLELTNEPGGGSVSESVGGGMVMTEICAEPVAPTAFVATAVMVAGEVCDVRSTVADQVPSAATVAVCPFTLTVAGLMEVTLPVTATCAGSETGELSAGAAIVTCGVCVSMLKVTVMGLTLPALSVAWRVTLCAAPSAATETSPGQVRMPLSASLQVKLTVTAVLFQPAAFGAGLTVAVMVGGVRSTMSAGGGLIDADPPAFVPEMVSVCEPSPPRL